MKTQRLLMYEDQSLTDYSAKGYAMRYGLEAFRHNNKDIILEADGCFYTLKEFFEGLKDFHRKGLLVFKEPKRVAEFAQKFYKCPFNVTSDFHSWGEFNFGEILQFCESFDIMPRLTLFNLDLCSEVLLNVGECLEDECTAIRLDRIRVFLAPPGGINHLTNTVERMVRNFSNWEARFIALDALKSDRMLEILENYLEKFPIPSVKSYRITDLGTTDCSAYLAKLADKREQIVRAFHAGMPDEPITMIHLFKEIPVFREFEVSFEHEPLEGARYVDYFINKDKLYPYVVGNPSSTYLSVIKLDHSLSKVEFTEKHLESSKLKISLTLAI